ncbi:NAD-dependent epimerase/dehydratase family protein [Candidatus Pacearchaeota archaeon]|nr:NAD-dependent epimerase/dehydratase family protein [Candidatus Pacearchaeota archaeon]
MDSKIAAPQKKVAVTGAGGFIGHHLVNALKKKGHWVRGIDIKNPEFTKSEADEFWFADLRNKDMALKLLTEMDEVYALAADVGGVGHLSRWNYEIIKNNLEIDTNTIEAVLKSKGKKILYTSSACVYPLYKQKTNNPLPLKEEDAMPADPEGAYGWEKLTAEQILEHASRDHGLQIRIARFQNVYGPEETFEGGREKVVGALCRKIAIAKEGESIEVWGDGLQKRSFCYVDDCVISLIELMESSYSKPLNVSIDKTITINNLTKLIIKSSGKKLKIKNISGPEGVRGRMPDVSMRKKVLKYIPKTSIQKGLNNVYLWVESEINRGK